MEFSEKLLEIAYRIILLDSCKTDETAAQNLTKIIVACDKHGMSVKKFLDVLTEAFKPGGSDD